MEVLYYENSNLDKKLSLIFFRILVLGAIAVVLKFWKYQELWQPYISLEKQAVPRSVGKLVPGDSDVIRVYGGNYEQ